MGVNQILRGAGNGRVRTVHFVEGGDGINGEDLLDRRRIEDGTDLEPARIGLP